MNEEIDELNKDVEKLNYLYFKSTSIDGLTQKEIEEQNYLRDKFIKFFKKNLDY